MDVQDEGRKEGIVLKPQSRQEAKACLCSIFTETQPRAWTFLTLQFSSLLKVLLLFVIPWSFTVFGEWARLSGVLVLYSTCRTH